MGAWGTSTFENDDAEDWLEELTLADNLLILEVAFEMIDGDCLEWPEACYALAAAEIVAALRGVERHQLPDDVKYWVELHQSEDTSKLVSKAIAAIEQVKGEKSELNELWRNSQYYRNWLEDVDELKKVLIKAA